VIVEKGSRGGGSREDGSFAQRRNLFLSQMGNHAFRKNRQFLRAFLLTKVKLTLRRNGRGVPLAKRFAKGTSRAPAFHSRFCNLTPARGCATLK
jgi:hypothetical protein